MRTIIVTGNGCTPRLDISGEVFQTAEIEIKVMNGRFLEGCALPLPVKLQNN